MTDDQNRPPETMDAKGLWDMLKLDFPFPEVLFGVILKSFCMALCSRHGIVDPVQISRAYRGSGTIFRSGQRDLLCGAEGFSNAPQVRSSNKGKVLELIKVALVEILGKLEDHSCSGLREVYPVSCASGHSIHFCEVCLNSINSVLLIDCPSPRSVSQSELFFHRHRDCLTVELIRISDLLGEHSDRRERYDDCTPSGESGDPLSYTVLFWFRPREPGWRSRRTPRLTRNFPGEKQKECGDDSPTKATPEPAPTFENTHIDFPHLSEVPITESFSGTQGQHPSQRMNDGRDYDDGCVNVFAPIGGKRGSTTPNPLLQLDHSCELSIIDRMMVRGVAE